MADYRNMMEKWRAWRFDEAVENELNLPLEYPFSSFPLIYLSHDQSVLYIFYIIFPRYIC